MLTEWSHWVPFFLPPSLLLSSASSLPLNPINFTKKAKEVLCTNRNRYCYPAIQITVSNFPAHYPLRLRVECLSKKMMLLSNNAKQPHICRLDSSPQLHDNWKITSSLCSRRDLLWSFAEHLRKDKSLLFPILTWTSLCCTMGSMLKQMLWQYVQLSE